MTLFEMREKKYALESELQTIKDYLLDKAADPTAPMEDLQAKQAKAEELQGRLKIVEDSIKAEEDAQRKRLSLQNGSGAGMTEEQAKLKAKADFYRAAFMGGNLDKAYEGLGGIPASNADLGSGDKLLPKTMSDQLILEPTETNPLRTICRITNITGLEEPKLGFSIDDAAIGDVTDKETAKEIQMSGDSIAFQRLKMKVSATLKDTIMYGSDLDVVSAVETALRSALAKREKYFAFLPQESAASDDVHKHMSFYADDNAVKEIEGATLYEAIVNAYADLADDFAANASIVMKKDAYYGMVKELTNDSEALFGSKPASVLGVPVVFCDKASVPVVGDFDYYGINYDIGAVFETDKDGKKGEYYFILTAWGDQQIRLKSAFRRAKVNP